MLNEEIGCASKPHHVTSIRRKGNLYCDFMPREIQEHNTSGSIMNRSHNTASSIGNNKSCQLATRLADISDDKSLSHRDGGVVAPKAVPHWQTSLALTQFTHFSPFCARKTGAAAAAISISNLCSSFRQWSGSENEFRQTELSPLSLSHMMITVCDLHSFRLHRAAVPIISAAKTMAWLGAAAPRFCVCVISDSQPTRPRRRTIRCWTKTRLGGYVATDDR